MFDVQNKPVTTCRTHQNAASCDLLMMWVLSGAWFVLGVLPPIALATGASAENVLRLVVLGLPGFTSVAFMILLRFQTRIANLEQQIASKSGDES